MSVVVSDVDALVSKTVSDCDCGEAHINQMGNMAVTKLVEATNGYSLVEAENNIWYDIAKGPSVNTDF